MLTSLSVDGILLSRFMIWFLYFRGLPFSGITLNKIHSSKFMLISIIVVLHLRNYEYSKVWFYGTSNIVGYLMPNPFSYI